MTHKDKLVHTAFLWLDADNTVLQCGNYEVEDDEECDAGLLGMVGRDSCCSSSCHYMHPATCRFDVIAWILQYSSMDTLVYLLRYLLGHLSCILLSVYYSVVSPVM